MENTNKQELIDLVEGMNPKQVSRIKDFLETAKRLQEQEEKQHEK